MATSVTLNGNTYLIPDGNNDGSNWGTGSEGLTAYLVVLPTAMLTKAGGSAALTADLNLGTNFRHYS